MRRVSRGTAAVRRRRDWADLQSSMAFPIASKNATDFLGTWTAVAGGSREGLTVGTMHLSGAIVWGAGHAAGDNVRFGAIVLPSSVPVAQMPDPVNQPYADWLAVWTVVISASGATLDSTTPWSRDFHGKRKLMASTNSLYIVGFPGGGVAVGASLIHGRVLLYLP